MKKVVVLHEAIA